MKIKENRVVGEAVSVAALLLLLLAGTATPARAQAWFTTGTGLGVSKPKVAVADLAGRTQPASPLAATFSEVVRADLDYSGVVDVASKSFYPTQAPTQPSELNPQPWTSAPVSAQFLAFGNVTMNGNNASFAAWFNDLQNPSAPPVVGQIYQGAATNGDARKFAHQFADAIIARL